MLQMLSFSLSLFMFFSYAVSLVQKPNFCVNCKHFIGDRDSPTYAKCSFFPKTEANKANYLVNGAPDMNDYDYCSTARQITNMCGEEGIHYVKKYKKRISKLDHDIGL